MNLTDSMPLSGESEFTPDERTRLRALLREEDRMNWARRKMRIFAPLFVGLVVGAWQLFDWIMRHVSFKP